MLRRVINNQFGMRSSYLIQLILIQTFNFNFNQNSKIKLEQKCLGYFITCTFQVLKILIIFVKIMILKGSLSQQVF
ncbi:unnamed protein product [Paramecium pentaurelia]|uniref:Transmembrane protein n=1 Tax=Paramecium pentaurelia TaxID=43138 RepID=A0A8S1VLA5_9CILI|nr:unnamed protein product [Paramecium pentaurelia]